MKLYSNRKYSYTSLKEGKWKFQGDGGWKSKSFKEKYAAKLEILVRWGGGCK